jgi:hypothetical protein
LYRASPMFAELAEIFRKTSGLADGVAEALSSHRMSRFAMALAHWAHRVPVGAFMRHSSELIGALIVF